MDDNYSQQAPPSYVFASPLAMQLKWYKLRV
jgi:hypothetical protein